MARFCATINCYLKLMKFYRSTDSALIYRLYRCSYKISTVRDHGFFLCWNVCSYAYPTLPFWILFELPPRIRPQQNYR